MVTERRWRRFQAWRLAAMNDDCRSVGFGSAPDAARASHASAWRSSSPRSSGLVRRPPDSHALARVSTRVWILASSMSTCSAWSSSASPASKSSDWRRNVQFSCAIAPSSAGSSAAGGSCQTTGTMRLPCWVASESSVAHTLDATELGLMTKTNTSDESIASRTDDIHWSAGMIPAQSTHTSRPDACSASTSLRTNSTSSRAYEMNVSAMWAPLSPDRAISA